MNYQELYPEINLTELKHRARRWATKNYSVIKEISVFRSDEIEPKYILVAEAYHLQAEIPHLRDIPEPKKKAEFAKFRNDWSDPTCLHIRDDLIDVLKTEKPSSENVSEFLDQWLCYAKTPEDELPNELINPKTECVLYEKKEGPPLDDIHAISNHKDFVRNLRVYHETDFEIRIQEPGKRAKIYNFKELGFRSFSTKAWVTFLNVFEDPNHTYWVGPAHAGLDRVAGYDRRQKRLRFISKKLVKFFNENYSAGIPEKFNLFELCPDKRPGTYKAKFKIAEAEYEGFEKDKVISEIEDLIKKYRTISDSGIETGVEERLNCLIGLAIDKEWITKAKVESMLKLEP